MVVRIRLKDQSLRTDRPRYKRLTASSEKDHAYHQYAGWKRILHTGHECAKRQETVIAMDKAGIEQSERDYRVH